MKQRGLGRVLRGFRSKRPVGIGIVIATLAVLLVPFASPAGAYDQYQCNWNTDTRYQFVKQFRMSNGNTDFGDDWHVGGDPQGTAIVCSVGNYREWYQGSQLVEVTRPVPHVRVLGKLYWDSGIAGCAGAYVKTLNSAGQVTQSSWFRKICSSGGLRSMVVDHEFSDSNPENIDKVLVRLYRRFDGEANWTRVGPDFTYDAYMSTPSCPQGCA